MAVNTAPGEITVNVGSGAITIIGTATAPIIAGTITNSGIISNTVAAGIYLQGDAQSGTILNNTGSTISGQTYGIEATSSNIIAGITNDGTISGGTDGIYFGGGGGTTTGITNNTGATISGSNNGMYFTGTSSGQAGG
ncbi:MAG: hypothetical protein Q7S51_05720, partial [Gallionellaceae bacterium]|nr:hypothetical protein [Gallionellaceae bacterium]